MDREKPITVVDVRFVLVERAPRYGDPGVGPGGVHGIETSLYKAIDHIVEGSPVEQEAAREWLNSNIIRTTVKR